MGGYGNYQIMGYKHLEELQETLDDIMLRRLKDEVLDLPEKTYIDEFVEMTTKQAQIYKEIHMDVQANIDQIKKATNPLSEMIRLRQATGYTGILSSTIQESAKLDRMEELVEEAIENKKKVVVFSNWTQITDVVYDRLVKKYRVGRITGQTNDDDRVKIVNAYQNGNIDVMIGTIGAMGTGLTLTAGSVEIFLDHPWNRALYDQAVDRCHRIGQKSNITVYNLLTKNTIDERIWELVCKKGKMADAIVDGQLNNMDRSDLVDYLLS
jgi:SNF2 family DNA or RNA helicase